jgi:hypothetical protein
MVWESERFAPLFATGGEREEKVKRFDKITGRMNSERICPPWLGRVRAAAKKAGAFF